MACDRCSKGRLFRVGGKSSDRNSWSYAGRDGDGYLPHVQHICGGDYFDFTVCLDCGKIQGCFPVVSEELERDPAAEALNHFLDDYGSDAGRRYSLGLVNPTHLVDQIGFRFGHRLHKWARDVYGFMVERETEYTYVFIDPDYHFEKVTLYHNRHVAPEYVDLRKIED